MNASKLANYTNVKSQQLWTTLYHCAKENPKRRFHALYDKVYRPDILAEAWRRVKRNKGGHYRSNIAVQQQFCNVRRLVTGIHSNGIRLTEVCANLIQQIFKHPTIIDVSFSGSVVLIFTSYSGASK